MLQSPINHKVKIKNNSWSNSSMLCFRVTLKTGPWRIFLKHPHRTPNQEAWQKNQRHLIYLQKLLCLCHSRVGYAACSAQIKLDCRITFTEATRNQTAKCLNVTSAIEVTCPRLSLNVISEKTHMGIYRHICPICKKGFSNRGGSQGHLVQGCHVSGKSQGKTKFSPGQGIVREFWKNVREFWPFD